MGKALVIKNTVNIPEFPKEFDRKSALYMEAVGIVFRVAVFRYLGVLIKYSRVETGRLKSAWTPIMEEFKYDYTKFWTYGPKEEAQAVNEGKESGSYVYNPEVDPFTLIIVNSVKYAIYVEKNVGVTIRGDLASQAPLFESYFLEGYEYLNSRLQEDFDKGTFPGQNQLPSEVY